MFHGLAPYLPTPRADARWWWASGAVVDQRLVVEILDEGVMPPQFEGSCGVAAPLSLPGEFLDSLLRDPATMTPRALSQAARSFAGLRKPGAKYPLRPGETRSALERDRLARLQAELQAIEESLAALD